MKLQKLEQNIYDQLDYELTKSLNAFLKKGMYLGRQITKSNFQYMIEDDVFMNTIYQSIINRMFIIFEDQLKEDEYNGIAEYSLNHLQSLINSKY